MPCARPLSGTGKAVGSGDFRALQSAARRLKEAAASLSADAVARAAEKLERTGKDMQTVQRQETIQELKLRTTELITKRRVLVGDQQSQARISGDADSGAEVQGGGR
ncbi:MAG: Hpt domain-containing protein [Pseudomonadota bacterium]